jgi:hypothetical protein
VKLTGEKGQSFGLRWPIQPDATVPDILLCLKMTVDGFVEIYNGPFPTELLEGKTSSNGQISLGLGRLSTLNPRLLPRVRSFDSINRWFKSTPELAEVA